MVTCCDGCGSVGWRKTPMVTKDCTRGEAVVTAVEEVEAAEAGVAVIQKKAVAVGKVAVVAEEREVAAAGGKGGPPRRH
ncbi:hypothetical protein CYMTET_21847 [Cymbomonas tetramitiformis]|uniref:Uncharacterized protein n=1 Tax=Cymbomonas tetramitiformis TaxID=36881 RepID=A0AAE0G1D4_9CHLO|nr:hypothetical protein CYMTET_21847 [Cymbomonas tetramitiformis]